MIIPRKYVELKKGRVTLPKALTDQVGLKEGEKIALCSLEEYGEVFLVKPLNEIEGLKVVTIVPLDEKRRFVFPAEFLSGDRNETALEVYILDGNLILEELNV